MITNKSELKTHGASLLAQGIFIEEVSTDGCSFIDTQEQKTSIHRFTADWDKEAVIASVIEKSEAQINWDRLKELMMHLDDSLLVNVNRIVFLETEADRDILLDLYGEDVMNYDEHVGIMLHIDDTVIVNIQLIVTETAAMCGRDAPEFVQMVNWSIWTTLIHELRHVWQLSLLNQLYGDDIDDIEEDAEAYSVTVFKSVIEPLDHHIWDVK